MVSVPTHDVLAFKSVFNTFNGACTEYGPRIPDCSSPQGPRWVGDRHRSPFPEPPTPPPVTPPWMADGLGVVNTGKGSKEANDGYQQQPWTFQAEEFPKAWLSFAQILPARTASDKPTPPPAFPPAYPNPPKGRAINAGLNKDAGSHIQLSPLALVYPDSLQDHVTDGGKNHSMARPASVSSYDSMLASHLIPRPEPARPHTPVAPLNAPNRTSHSHFTCDLSVLPPTNTQEAEMVGVCTYCEKGLARRYGNVEKK